MVCIAACFIWSGVARADCYAVGHNGTILRYDGTGWSTVTGVPGWDYINIWGSANDDIYVAGEPSYNSLLHYDGSAWSEITVGDPTMFAYDYRITDVYGLAGDDVYAFGSYIGHPDTYVGIVFHYDGTSWTPIISDFHGIDHQGWVSDNEWIFANGTAWNAMQQYEDGFAIARYPDGGQYINPHGLYYDIWGTDSAFVVTPGMCWTPPEGSQRNVLVYDGGAWRYLYMDDSFEPPSFTMPWVLYGVWGNSATEVFFVGADGAIVYFDGHHDEHYTNWHPMTSGTTETLWDVGGRAADDVYAVGMNGTILHYDGVDWTAEESGTSEMLRAVWMSPDDEIATLLCDFDIDAVEGGVTLTWILSDYDEEDRFAVLRSEQAGGELRALDGTAIDRDGLRFSYTDRTAEPGSVYRYRVDVVRGDSRRVLFETETVTVPAAAIVLQQNFPNPFNPLTTIRYHVPEECRVVLTVYDAAGRRVARLVDQVEDAGWHAVVWNGRDERGNPVTSGVYFYRLRAGREHLERSMVLMR